MAPDGEAKHTYIMLGMALVGDYHQFHHYINAILKSQWPDRAVSSAMQRQQRLVEAGMGCIMLQMQFRISAGTSRVPDKQSYGYHANVHPTIALASLTFPTSSTVGNDFNLDSSNLLER